MKKAKIINKYKVMLHGQEVEVKVYESIKPEVVEEIEIKKQIEDEQFADYNKDLTDIFKELINGKKR